MAAPGTDDMVAAKLLYVKMKMDYTKNPDVKSIADLRGYLGDGKGTEPWAALPGLRHKYFTYNNETETCCGVYVFYSQTDLDAYMNTDLFKGAPSWPHVAELTYEVKDVVPGTEKCIEKSKWTNSPPTREDVTAGKMLIVDITMKYDTGIEGLPTKKEDLYYFFDAGGYTTTFADLEGLRGKYFAYDDKIDHCYGFYTFVNEESLKKYMASELFTKQGEPPHIADLKYEVQDILEGTERTMDLGSWGKILFLEKAAGARLEGKSGSLKQTAAKIGKLGAFASSGSKKEAKSEAGEAKSEAVEAKSEAGEASEAGSGVAKEDGDDKESVAAASDVAPSNAGSEAPASEAAASSKPAASEVASSKPAASEVASSKPAASEAAA